MGDMGRKTNTLGNLDGLTRLSRLSFVACTKLKRRRFCVVCGANDIFSATKGADQATIRYKNELIFEIAKRGLNTSLTPLEIVSSAFRLQVKRGRNAYGTPAKLETGEQKKPVVTASAFATFDLQRNGLCRPRLSSFRLPHDSR
jgi:hypothetical protein